MPAGRRTRRGNQSPSENGPYHLSDPSSFDLVAFSDAKNLQIAFQGLVDGGGHGAGIDGFRPEHFSSTELWPVLRIVSRALKDGTYRPYPTRRVEVPKSATKVRTLSLQKFTDRAVAKALLNCLTPFWKVRINRLDVLQIYAQLEREIRRRRIYVLAIDDIKECFPNTPRGQVMQWHGQYINHPELLRLIERFIWGHDDLRLIGLDQGSPYSPIAVDVLLHHILDTELEARSRNTPLFRYVDNLTFLCSDVREGTSTLEIARESVERIGYQLKGTDGEPQDLRDPSYDHVLLGLIPRWQDGRLTFSIPETAYSHLAEGLRYANDADNPPENALLRCKGWIGVQGPAFTQAAEREVVGRVTEMALQAGFRSIIFRDLLEVAREARRRWHQASGGVTR